MKDTRLEKKQFGETPEGEKVYKYTLRNVDGMEVDIINYGGIISRWTSKDKDGNQGNIVLNFNDLRSYMEGGAFLGALIGRFANRISNSSFILDKKKYELNKNENENHLHGGEKGFDKVIWNATTRIKMESTSLILTYTSHHMEEGYPGNLDVKVTYTLKDDNALEVQYEASTDRPTIINLTQHSYFNLSADFSRDILDHELLLNAESYLPVNDKMIPIGEYRPVEGTPFEFGKYRTIGDSIFDNDEQLLIGKGYDHCWILDKENGNLELAASLYHWRSGRRLEVYTTEPSIQFYSGNLLSGYCTTDKKIIYGKRQGLCLEPQHYPDSPNQSRFPSVRLDPGTVYRTKTIYKLSVV